MGFLWFVPALGWAALIFVLSSIPNPPGATGSEWQSNVAHMTEYAVLAVLLAWALGRSVGWNCGLVGGVTWAGCLLYGVSDEWHQSFVANRDSSAMDVAFDALGAALGVAAVWAWRAWRPEEAAGER